jgi:AmpE protein
MELIAILICLALQRFADMGGWFKSSWFETYLKVLSPRMGKLNEWVVIFLIIVPILLLLALLHFIFASRLFGLFDLILATFILFFCIDARDLRSKLAVYFANIEKGDSYAAAEIVVDFVGDVSSDTPAELNRAVTKAILLNSFEQLFAGLFWFMIFGVYGVTAYFLVRLLRKNALRVDSNYIELAKLAARIQDALDWIPSRLVGISYALVGNFNKGFGYCNRSLLSGLTGVRRFSVDSGLAALDVESDSAKAVVKENYAALDLIDHALIIWLVGLILVLLGVLLS